MEDFRNFSTTCSILLSSKSAPRFPFKSYCFTILTTEFMWNWPLHCSTQMVLNLLKPMSTESNWSQGICWGFLTLMQ